jgi:Stigma-specific protein, Stig1
MTAKIVVAVSLVLAACSSSAGTPSGSQPSQFVPGNLPAANDMPGALASACAPGDPNCAAPAACTGPECGCAAGQLSCGGVCVDAAARDELTCVTRIDPGAMQQPGMSTCAPGQSSCGGRCVDLGTDASNCGACGVQCGTGACSAGKCPAGKSCATELAVSTPLVTDFESYASATPPEMWNFSFNAPPGQALAVYAGTYQFSDGTGAQSLRMVAGNSSNYAASIANTSASAWGGGMGLWMGCIDASQFDGLAFDVRGNVPRGLASVSLAMQQTSAPALDDPNAGGTCTTGCQAPSQAFPVASGWSRVLLPWKQFAAGSANQAAVPATGRDITGLSFNLALDWQEVPGAPGTYGPLAAGYELAIDNLGFFRTSDLCPPGQQVCDSRCVDPEQSNEHCGGCGNACSGGSMCAGSAAGCVCPNGLTLCSGECVDLANDTSHCGECSNFCSIGSTCSQGACSGGLGTTSQRCGETTRLLGNPLGCGFGWGSNPAGAIPNYLSFASKWVGYEPDPTTRCDGCTWLQSYGNLNVVPMYIAYFTAYHANIEAGLGDCNLDFNGNLCSGGAQYIRDNRRRLIAMYESYAQRSYAAYPRRPVIWVLEPDFSQYAEGQSGNPLSMTELGAFASEIICAIKTNMPNAVIAINHSPWLTGDQVRSFWGAMPLDLVDLIHVTGTANVPGGYFNGGDANNRVEGTFRYLSQLTGKGILADTSFGITTVQDSWSSATTATLNARIADGVVGALIYPEPNGYAQRIANLTPQLDSTCR